MPRRLVSRLLAGLLAGLAGSRVHTGARPGVASPDDSPGWFMSELPGLLATACTRPGGNGSVLVKAVHASLTSGYFCIRGAEKGIGAAELAKPRKYDNARVPFISALSFSSLQEKQPSLWLKASICISESRVRSPFYSDF